MMADANGRAESMRSVLHRSVLTADTADSVGEVKGFVFEVPPVRARAIWVSGRAGHAGLVEWDHVQMGPDAVIVDHADRVREVTDDAEKQAVERGDALLGTRLLDTRGFEHGTVDDVMLDTATGAVTAISGGGMRIEPDRLRGFGAYALVFDEAD
jgi:sporulation protein YlmC with PRC-barrel domain